MKNKWFLFIIWANSNLLKHSTKAVYCPSPGILVNIWSLRGNINDITSVQKPSCSDLSLSLWQYLIARFLLSVQEINEWVTHPVFSSCFRETRGTSQFQSRYPRWMLSVRTAWLPSASRPPCPAQSPRAAPRSTAPRAEAPPAARPTPSTRWRIPTTTI